MSDRHTCFLLFPLFSSNEYVPGFPAAVIRNPESRLVPPPAVLLRLHFSLPRASHRQRSRTCPPLPSAPPALPLFRLHPLASKSNLVASLRLEDFAREINVVLQQELKTQRRSLSVKARLSVGVPPRILPATKHDRQSSLRSTSFLISDKKRLGPSGVLP